MRAGSRAEVRFLRSPGDVEADLRCPWSSSDARETMPCSIPSLPSPLERPAQLSSKCLLTD